MKVFKLFLFSLLLIFSVDVFSQGMGISEVSITPAASSILELRSTTKGFLVPRMTSVERDAILTPANSLLIYNSTTNQYNYYNGASWSVISPSSDLWSLKGNYGTDPVNDFIGTADAKDLVFRTNNSARMRITSSGTVGIGATPSAGVMFEVQSTGGVGIFGVETGANMNNYGIYGDASGGTNSNIGVLGYGTSIALGDTAYGVLGAAEVSGGGIGVGTAGWIQATDAVAIAVSGGAEQKSGSTSGTYYGGIFTSDAFGTGATGIGVYGSSTGAATNWAGYFENGDVYINNNLGIGTTSPAEKLDVQGRIFMLAGTAPTTTANRLYNVSGNLFWNGTQLNSSGNIAWTRSAPNVFLTEETDNMGIGTTAPQAKLHVADNVGNTMLLQVSSLTDNGEVSTLRTRGTIAAPTEVMASDYLGVFSFLGYNSASSIVTGASIQSVAAENFTGTANGANMIFATTPVGSTGNIPRMTILDNGNVGIGLSSPVNILDVEGALAVGATYSGTNTAPANGMLVEGNVGIGTSIPDQKLDVRGNLYVQNTAGSNSDDIVIKRPGAASSTNIRFTLSERNTNQNLWLYGHDGATFKNFIEFDFPNYKINFPAGSNNLVIDNANSRIGMGVTSPNSRLDISSSSTSYPYATQVQNTAISSPTNNVGAVYGASTGASGATISKYGGIFESSSGSGTNYGVRGNAVTGSGTNYGVYGTATGTGTNVGGYFTATGGANNFALIVPSGGGNVGIGTTTPAAKLHLDNAIRMGSETGTSQGPTYPAGNSGLVIRRIYSTSITAGQIVAKTDQINFERNGTNGGWQVNRIGANVNQVCNCTGVNSTGTVVGKSLNNLASGVTALYAGGDNMVFIHCIFGDPYNAGHTTEVRLTREASDFYWIGTLTTTFNQ